MKKFACYLLGIFCWVGCVQGELIRVGDVLEISLKGVPATEQVKVNSRLEVRDNGMIRVPMTHKDIRAAGRKPQDVERSIESAFVTAELYVSPTISIQVHKKKKIEEEMRKVVIVDGEVKRTGRVQYREGMTLMEALGQAGGRGTFASKYLYLTRLDRKSGKLLRHKLLYTHPKTKVMKLLPNDAIFIPQRVGIIDRGRE